MPGRLPLVVLAAAALACGSDPAAPAASADPAAVGDAVADCSSGDPAAGIRALDAALRRAPGDPDALVARGLCRWARWAETDDADDARAAYADLSDAIAAVEGGAEAQTPLDEIYAHRAFVAHALDDAWVRTLEDLDRAAALDPDEPRHALDRGVVRSYAGDTAAARAALAEYLVLADSAGVPDADASRSVVEALLEDLGR